MTPALLPGQPKVLLVYVLINHTYINSYRGNRKLLGMDDIHCRVVLVSFNGYADCCI